MKERPIQEPVLSRRELFRGATVAAGALATAAVREAQAQSGETREQKRQPRETTADAMIDRALHEKIDFTGERQLWTPDSEIERLVLDVFHAQEKIEQAMRVYEAAAGQPDRHERVSAAVERVKQELWQKLLKHFPDLKEPYDETKLYEVMFSQLPRRLAGYGVLAHPHFNGLSSRLPTGQDAFVAAEFSLDFMALGPVRSEQVTQWGKTFRRDRITLQDPIRIAGRDMVSSAATIRTEAGVTAYQNVFINEQRHDAEAKRIEEALKRQRESPADMQNIQIDTANPQEFTTVFNYIAAGRTSEEMKQRAFLVSTNKALKFFHRNGVSIANSMAGTEAHEDAHLGDSTDQEFRSHFAKRAHTQPVEYAIGQANHGIHAEINGHLGRLGYGVEAPSDLHQVMSVSMPSGLKAVDFIHHRAARWVIDMMVRVVLAKPEQYGVRVEPASQEMKENQVLMQLIDVAERNISDFHNLVEQVMRHHRLNYGHDFSEEYFAYRGIKRPPKGEKSAGTTPPPPPEPNIRQLLKEQGCKLFGASLAVAGGILYVAKKFIERRRAVAKAVEVKKPPEATHPTSKSKKRKEEKEKRKKGR